MKWHYSGSCFRDIPLANNLQLTVAVDTVALSDLVQIQNFLVQERVVQLDSELFCSGTDLCKLLCVGQRMEIGKFPVLLIHVDCEDQAIAIPDNI